VDFRVLGALEVWDGDRVVAVRGSKQRALLSLLLLQAGEVVSRDRLLAELWPDRPPGMAGHSLDHQVSRLRKALEPTEPVVTRPGGYALEVEPDQIDVRRFERLLAAGRAANAEGRPGDAASLLVDALALWRGGAYADVAYEAFARDEISRLHELRLAALEERIDADLALGRHQALVAELESLAATYPFRERVRGQQMLALYRSGRQVEALRAFADTRRRLVDELGLEPGPALKELERAILRHDPALDAPAARAAKPRSRLVAAGALLLAAGAAAGGVLLANGGTSSSHAQPLAQPDSVALVSAGTGEVVGQASAVRAPLLSRFGAGALWNVSLTGQLTKIDPTTGKVVWTLNTGAAVPCGLAVAARSVWVTDCTSPTLVRIDAAQPVVAARITLPDEPDISGEDTGEVVVGAGSVWVARGFANPAWVDRLDPATGRERKRILIPMDGAQRLGFGDGALWVAGDVDAAGVPKLSRIDPRTNDVTPTLSSFRKTVCCVAAGGGFVWAGTFDDHTIWKVDRDGSLVGSVRLPADAQNVIYGAVWAAAGDSGTVLRIDPTTNAKRTYRLGHDLLGVAAGRGLFAVGVHPSAQDVTAGLKGRIVRVALKSNQLDWGASGTDPVQTITAFDQWQVQFQYATCAKLLDYPDASGAAGTRLVPEAASAWPVVTDGGRTYTFRIRSGLGFSPPSHEAVTAESFRHEIERVLLNAGPRLPLLADIAGAEAFSTRKSTRLPGVTANGDELVIRLRRPMPGLPSLLALPWFCAVPASLPTVGLPYPIPTAGPYYVADRSTNAVVLKPNPNYHGPRPRRLDAIVYRFNVDVPDAIAGIERDRFDYVEEEDPALDPSTGAARNARDRYSPTPNDWTEGLVLNTHRPLFADRVRRRAVAYALDREALAAAVGAAPTSRMLPPSFPGYDQGHSFAIRADLRTARRLMGRRPLHAVFAVETDDAGGLYDPLFVRAVQKQLAAAGIAVTVLTWRQSADPEQIASVLAHADLARAGTNAGDSYDPVVFLQDSHGISYWPAGDRTRLDRVAALETLRREAAAAALTASLERDAVYLGFGIRTTPELVSKRLSCLVRQPKYPGLDLAALCLRRA
jgi:DNA-binding SARP family transcriptional activator/ABC-type transport system substrate-binding protein